MAKTNQVIENAIIGDKVKFLITSEDSKGELLRVELWCKPGAKGTPMHHHPLQRETFTVQQGLLGIDVTGQSIVLKPGETYTILPGMPHRFYNASSNQPVLVTVDLRPALKTEYFFETLYALAREGKTNKDAVPKNPLQFAAMMHEYYGEMFVDGPPLGLQKFMAKGLGGFAKLIGYKGFIPFE